jgi:hypothetical protein
MTSIDLAPRRMLRRTDAAKYIEEKWGARYSPKTLAKLAVVGGGPKFRKAGRIPLYEQPHLDDWVRAKLSSLVSSTSELEGRERGAGSQERAEKPGGIATTNSEASVVAEPRRRGRPPKAPNRTEPREAL